MCKKGLDFVTFWAKSCAVLREKTGFSAAQYVNRKYFTVRRSSFFIMQRGGKKSKRLLTIIISPKSSSKN